MHQGLLNRFAYNVTSQGGEDGIIYYLISHLPAIPHRCCEFGAWDGKHLSNVYTLWHDQDWQAVLIESDENRCLQIKNHAQSKNILIFNQFVSILGADSLDELFRQHGLEPELGVLSIDIDSHDYHLWKHLNYVRPWILVIEHNPTIPATIDYYDPEDEIFFLCSVTALERLGKEKGYRLVACTRSNSIFVKQEFCSSDWLPESSADALFSPIHRRRWIVDSQLFPDRRHKNRYPGFFAGPRGLRRAVKWLRMVHAKSSGRPFLEPSDRIRRRAEAAGIHCP